VGRKLTYTFDESGDHSTISVEPIGRDPFDWRIQYRWTVTVGNPVSQQWSGDEQRGPEPCDLPKALSATMSFLSAFAESRTGGKPNSENWDLYPDSMAEWAMAMSDEITMAQVEISPEEYA
jgi:hypothetical protein